MPVWPAKTSACTGSDHGRKAPSVRRIQATTIAGVALLAAVVSFFHMHELCLRHGEDHLAAVLIPLAVDGTIVVASMSILLANRHGSRGSALA